MTIKLRDGTEKEKDLAELEERGHGRRDNCRRCETNIPIMADIACGKWGTTGENTTFIEVCSEKGSDFISAATEANYIKVEQPSGDAIETRRRKDGAAIELARQWQDVCPMELPLSRLIFMLSRELAGIFDYEPGMDVSALPPLRTVTDQELSLSDVEVAF